MQYVVYYEYLFIAIVSLLVAIAGVIFELRTRFSEKRRKKINVLMATLFAEKIENIDQFFPKKYRTLSIVIPALEQIERKINSPYWNF